MLEEIKKFLSEKNVRGVKSALQAKSVYIEFLREMFGDIDLNEMIYMVLNDITSVPNAECGDKAKFISITEGYSYKCNKPFQGKGKCLICCSAVARKRKETYKEKTGYDNPAQNPEIQKKIGYTNEQRYGTRIAQQSEQVKQKSIETNIKKYGVVHPSQLESNKQQRLQTVQEKYGINNVWQLNKGLSARYEQFKTRFEQDGKFTLLSDESHYDNSNDATHAIMHWKCNECGNEFDKVALCLRCPKCEPYSSSTEEVNLYNYITSIYSGVVIQNSRNIIKGNEIDIFIPELKLGIEFNGEYWHRDEVRGKNYHQSKYFKMKEAGYKLITIYSNEWSNKTEIVKNRLKSLISVDSKIYARKCEVRLVAHEECDKFLYEHHIQGPCQSSIKLGLYYNDDLVALMTFGAPRFNKQYEYELLRYCSKGTVVGGASKLLKHFERMYLPKSLLSYADMNWSTGNLYEKIGFTLEEVTQPGYFYYDRKNEVVYSRHQCQKQKLIKKYNFDSSMTEKEMTKELGYFRIYDCGNLVYKKIY